jgi:hypothetical protein
MRRGTGPGLCSIPHGHSAPQHVVSPDPIATLSMYPDSQRGLARCVRLLPSRAADGTTILPTDARISTARPITLSGASRISFTTANNHPTV